MVELSGSILLRARATLTEEIGPITALGEANQRQYWLDMKNAKTKR